MAPVLDPGLDALQNSVLEPGLNAPKSFTPAWHLCEILKIWNLGQNVNLKDQKSLNLFRPWAGCKIAKVRIVDLSRRVVWWRMCNPMVAIWPACAVQWGRPLRRPHMGMQG